MDLGCVGETEKISNHHVKTNFNLTSCLAMKQSVFNKLRLVCLDKVLGCLLLFFQGIRFYKTVVVLGRVTTVCCPIRKWTQHTWWRQTWETRWELWLMRSTSSGSSMKRYDHYCTKKLQSTNVLYGSGSWWEWVAINAKVVSSNTVIITVKTIPGSSRYRKILCSVRMFVCLFVHLSVHPGAAWAASQHQGHLCGGTDRQQSWPQHGPDSGWRQGSVWGHRC